MQSSKKNTDLISAVLMLILSSVFWRQLSYVSEELDRIFPQFILIAMIVLSIILLIKSFIKPDLKRLFSVKNRKNVLVGVLITLLWVILLNVIGFGLTSFIAIITLALLLGGSHGKPSAILNTLVVALIVVFTVYMVFARFLEVPLPRGIFI